jgi:hypothetical protein
MCFCSGPEDYCSCGEEFNVTLEDEVDDVGRTILVVIAKVEFNYDDDKWTCGWMDGVNSFATWP